uniref:FYVE-type domain-containing protein n=1 Tax=Araucaria cunninghamii TaxID=56994 RepID=A0A0D6QS76_ARACU
MAGGRLYPHLEMEADAELEEKFYDFDSVHSYREQGNSSFSSFNSKIEEIVNGSPLHHTPAHAAKIQEVVNASYLNHTPIQEGVNASPLNHTPIHDVRVVQQNLGPNEMLDKTLIETYADTKTETETLTGLDFERKNEPEVPKDDLGEEKESDAHNDGNLSGRYFYYDSPHVEETGAWIPVSVPPMSESDHQEWTRSLGVDGGYFPEEDTGWQYGNQELTLWTVVSEMLAVISEKVISYAGPKPLSSQSSFAYRLMPKRILEQAWREMALTLTDTSFSNVKDILEAEPAKWLADSAAPACMLCNLQFHPIMRPRHHCRFCGLIFCGICSRGRSLLPVKFRTSDPQRVCDVCWVRLESVQGLLAKQVSHAAQEAIHDVTDLSTLRSWVNIPWGQSMENEIYKATNALRDFVKIGSLRPERSIPDTVLRRAKGLAILTVVKIGMMVTYKVGTGLVIARKEDGSWSPPSAISSIGVGWGLQAGGELTDFVIVLRTEEAVRTFAGNIHFSIGAGLNAAAGPVGRVVEADLRAGDGGSAACYTYSCSKGAFVGCSLEGNIVKTRTSTNTRFYGNSSIKACDILLGSIPRPTAAAPMYHALSDLFGKLQSG